jgi:cardiolipin synthase
MKAVPNILTVFRIILLPVFVWIYFYPNSTIAMMVFVVACVTDVLDGFIARKFQAISNFGKWADPLADKAMTLTAVTCLFIARDLPWYFLAFYLLKESLMVVGYITAYFRDGKNFHQAEIPGKIAMWITALCLGIVIFLGHSAANIMWLSVTASTFSVLYYFSYFMRNKKKS